MQSFGKCVKEGLLTRALASAPHMSLSAFSVSVSQIFYNWPGDFTGLSSAPWKWSTPHDVLAFRTTLTSITYHKWFQYDFIGQSKCVGILAHLSLSHLSLVLFLIILLQILPFFDVLCIPHFATLVITGNFTIWYLVYREVHGQLNAQHQTWCCALSGNISALVLSFQRAMF